MKFFHTSTLIRRRRNRVKALINDDGLWVDDKEQLKTMAVNFYSKLFSSETRVAADFISSQFP